MHLSERYQITVWPFGTVDSIKGFLFDCDKPIILYCMQTVNRFFRLLFIYQMDGHLQGLSQDLETGCPKLAIENILGVQIF